MCYQLCPCPPHKETTPNNRNYVSRKIKFITNKFTHLMTFFLCMMTKLSVYTIYTIPSHSHRLLSVAARPRQDHKTGSCLHQSNSTSRLTGRFIGNKHPEMPSGNYIEGSICIRYRKMNFQFICF